MKDLVLIAKRLGPQGSASRKMAGEYGRDDIPVIANADFGHTDPKWILPMGVRAELDPGGKRLRLLEEPVRA